MVTTLTSERPAAPAAPPRWIIPKPPDEDAVRALAEALSLPDIVCRLLLIRGYVTAEEAKSFLRPKLDRQGSRAAGARGAREGARFHPRRLRRRWNLFHYHSDPGRQMARRSGDALHSSTHRRRLRPG